MNTLSPLPETCGLPPASSVSLLSFSLCVAFTASPRHQLSVYMLLALGNTQLSQKPNSKFPGLSQVSNELLLVQLTMAKRHSSSTPQTQPQSVIPWVEGVYGPADDPKLLMGRFPQTLQVHRFSSLPSQRAHFEFMDCSLGKKEKKKTLLSMKLGLGAFLPSLEDHLR